MALIRPQIHLADETIAYDGSALRSHWIYERFGIQGDGAVAFVGPARVVGDDLVDLADRRAGAVITADAMLHVIVESFGPSLDRAVTLQRLLVLEARELLVEAGVGATRRRGDDLFVGQGKMSVSIATVSPVSCLVHLGVNVRRDGTPVETAALDDFEIDPRAFGEALLERFAEDLASMAQSTAKVRPVP